METKRTCSPGGLTDPPLAVIGIVLLLLAVPVLRVSELGFAGVTLTRTVQDATEAAKSASSAADRAAAAVLTFANTATSAASASSRSLGNLVVFGGEVNGPATAEAALAFTLAAHGVADAVVRDVGDVRAAVVMWLDRPTETLRPHTNPSGPGIDFQSPLGDAVRRAIPTQVTINDNEDLGAAGLAGVAPLKAVAVPAVRPGEAAAGLILVVLSDTADAAEVQDKVARYGLPAAVLIERLTTAGHHGTLPWEGH